MKFQFKLLLSIILVGLLFIPLFTMEIIPCTITPAPLGAQSYKTLCAYNQHQVTGFQNVEIYYLGFFESIVNLYIAVFLICFILTFVVISKIFKTKK